MRPAQTHLLAFAPDRGHEAVQAEIAERIGAGLRADLVDRVVRGDQLVVGRHVDAEVARVPDRRRRDAQVHFGRARFAQQRDDARRGRAANDRIVDDDDALSAQVLDDGIELQVDAARCASFDRG